MAEIRVNATGELKLYDSDDSNYVSFKSAGTVSSNVAWVLPSADGSSGQMLSTNGSGTLSWATPSSADPSSADGDSLGTASAEWSDLYLADGGIVYFGNDQDIRLIHNADKGLILKHSATADDKPIILTLQTGETDMAANDVIGKIEFQAPDEGTGTDAVLVSAAIQAVAEGNHSSSSNATRIEFMVGASEAAAKKMQLTSAGKLEVDGGLDVEGGVVFNEDSASVDFRVESNGDANCLIVDGSADKVGIGLAAPEAKLHVLTGDASVGPNGNADELVVEGSGNSGMSILSGNSSYGLIAFGDSGDDDIGYLKYDHSANKFTLSVNADGGTMIMTSDGNIQHGGTTNSGRYAAYTSGNEAVGYFQCTKSSSYNKSCMNVVGNQDTSDESYNIYKGSAGGTAKFFVRDSGNVENVNNSYGSSSDERIKQNITDANSQWDDIKALKVRNYKLKTEAAKGVDKTYLGVVAQEVEAAGMTGLVGGSTAEDGKTVALNSDFGTVYTEQDKTDGNIPEGKDVGDIKTLDQKVKSIKYSVLYMKAIKALQEAQTRIETLETKVKALEDA